MTPTLTNEQKYTPASGFEPGVVVEVIDVKNVKYTGYFTQLMLPDALSAYHRFQLDNGAFNVFSFMVKDIKSIRILSGPWAVWQFAPARAVGVEIQTQAQSPITWFIEEDVYEYVSADGDTDAYKYLPAPWWWLEGQKTEPISSHDLDDYGPELGGDN